MTLQSFLASASWWLLNWSVYMTTSNPSAVAAESYAYWKPLVRLPIHAFAWLAMEAGETSFRPNVVGDHGEAYGSFQDHAARIAEIKAGTGIDIHNCTHLQQLQAAHWESTAGWYKHVWPNLMATDTLWSAVSVLVKEFEQSAHPETDIPKRVALAEKLAKQFGVTL